MKALVLKPPGQRLFSDGRVLPAVRPARGEEDPVVCLLGRPGHPVVSGTGHWSAHLPPLPGESPSLRNM